MALTKVSLVDLNAGELILDLDADTSITSDTDDTIHFKIGGSDEITITGTALSPSTSDGNSLGTSALEWSDLFLADGAVINFGDDQDVSLTHVADTGLLLSSTDQLQFGDSGTYIHQSADGVLDLVSDTEIEINATTIDMNGALDVSGTITSGGVITGTAFTAGSAVLTEAELETLDGVTAGTAIASKVVTTDANIDTTGQRNLTISGELDAATGDFSGDVDIDGTANLDTVDIDGATQIDATVTVGVDDTGYDVKFFGDTSGAHMLWDASVDDLILAGAGRVVVPEGNLVLGSTAVTSTAAELNLLDGVSGLVQADLTKLAAIDATATELNLIDGGATVGTTAVADGDGIIHNDGGTMKVTSAATFKTYFQQGLSSAADDLDAGDAAVLITTSSGNITIDAAANDSDIILKGTDGGADTTFLTIDGSAAGEATFNAGIVIANAGNIGSASDKDAIAIASDGVVTMNQIPVLSAGLNVSGGTIAGTIATATQNSITTTTGLTTVGATQQLTTISGIPLYSDSTSLYTHNVSGTDDSAEYNTAIGFTALDAITTGDKNTAMGYGALGANTTGYNNTSIGHLAGLDITEGYQNTLVGDRAGTNITTGDNNTAIGQNAMQAVTTQNRNTAVGMDALKAGTNDDCVAIGAFALTANSTGADNTAVGSYALTANTTGGSNVAVGFDALKSNTTGNRNIVVGNEAMDASDTESDNMAIGHAAMTANNAGGTKLLAIGNYALDAATSGDQNVAVGYAALGATTTGENNTAVGVDALLTNSTGSNNTGLGTNALKLSTTGTQNVAVGHNALTANTTASQNTAVGQESLKANTTGASNTAVGAESLKANTTGHSNTALGQNSLLTNTTGIENTALGRFAMEAATTGSYNTAVGVSALAQSTTGEGNTAFSRRALYSLTTGARNVAVGYSSLHDLTTATDNVAVGYSALQSVTTGNLNTTVGYQAGNHNIGITTGTNNVCVGAYTRPGAVDGSNQVILGYDVQGSSANQVHIGSNAGKIYNSFASNATWTQSSDQRLKKNIQTNTLGLDFINDLRPVTYNWKKSTEIDSTDPHMVNHYDADTNHKDDTTKFHGFIAQEVKTALDTASVDNHGAWDLQNDGVQGVSLEAMVTPLVKAVQELSAKNTALEARVKALEDA